MANTVDAYKKTVESLEKTNKELRQALTDEQKGNKRPPQPPPAPPHLTITPHPALIMHAHHAALPQATNTPWRSWPV